VASLFKRAKDFAQSPQGKQLTEEVKEQASKPENRRKLKEFGQRFMKKRWHRRWPRPTPWWWRAAGRFTNRRPQGLP
jgi:hypothetical protein